MKKIIGIALLMLAVCVTSVIAAEDWSQYESGRNNIRLDGYHSQPGYIAFTDGDGTIRGYLYASSDYNLYWVSTGKITLKATRLDTAASGGTLSYKITSAPNP